MKNETAQQIHKVNIIHAVVLQFNTCFLSEKYKNIYSKILKTKDLCYNHSAFLRFNV